MTSRRSRIKGIVNIPQRRKPENGTIKEESDQLSANYKLETEFEVYDSKITIAKNEPTKSISEDNHRDNHLLPHPLEENPNTIKVLIARPASTEQVESVEENVIREELPEVKAAPAANTPPTAFKRKFLKADANYEISKKSIDNYVKIDSSTTYAVRESSTECFFPQRPKETITFSQPRKNAQANKLAEARREFVRRFGFSKPERHRLTMMDLIVYNPETNPMVNEVDTKESDTVNDADDPMKSEENVDEPSNTNDTQSNEENEIPMPQIKIEPSGEITLDEQSLVIEGKELQRKREELNKLKTGYGIYKKNKCIKFWTSSETVYFYKALNTIGTDFTLMCELFPNRTRRELIIKFKKEEKINRNLIDKALMQPCKFNYEYLKNEIVFEERELEANKKHQEEAKKFKEV